MIRNYLIILVAFLNFSSMAAQGLDESPAGVMISHGHPKGGFMFSYTYMNMLMKENLNGGSSISDAQIFSKNYSMTAQKMKMDMHMLMAMYGISGRLSVMAMTSYSKSNMDMMAYAIGHVHGGVVSTSLYHTHETSGLNDVKVWALYKLVTGKGSSLVASMGMNIPVGDITIGAGEHATFAGEHQTYMMQLGSGSIDLMPGITYFKSAGKIAWSIQALSVLRPFNNSIGYHLGNEINLNAWGAYQFIPLISASLRTELTMNGSISGGDNLIYTYTSPDANPLNYGGTKASAYAGINIYINKGILNYSKLGIEAGIPYYQNYNGIQETLKSNLYLCFTKSF